MNLSERLKEIGIEWPELPHPPSYYYKQLYDDHSPSIARADDLLFVTALPLVGGEPHKSGRLGVEVSVEEGNECAQRAAVSALYEIEHAIGNLDDIECFVQMTGFVASVPGFSDQPKVMNGASDLFIAVLGERGKHSRASIGCASLPGNNPMALALIAKVKPE